MRHGHHAASFAPVMRAVTSSGLVSLDRLVSPLLAAAHDDDAVANREDVGHAVRDQHHGDALLLQPMDQAQHLLDLADRDRGGRLVHHHELGVGEPRARDRDRLALAARHLLDEIVRAGLGAQLAEQFQRARRHRLVIEQCDRPEFALELAAEKDVCRRREIVGEREVLVDDLDADGAGIDRPV